jgi:HEAT repeat protein
MLIRWAGNQASAPVVKPLLAHPDEKVRMEALAVLLRFKDPGAVGLLRESLRSKDPDVVSQALFLAGQYRVYTLVEDILSLIKKVILFEADYTVNAEIIKALGEIGDPRAVPDLERLSRASWTLYPEALTKMKLALFEALGRYPKSAVEGLLALGEKAGDERIRRVCRKLAERK